MKNLEQIFYGIENQKKESAIKAIDLTEAQKAAYKVGIVKVMQELVDGALDFTEAHKNRFALIFDYFTGVESPERYNLNKGLYIVGETGVGKSLIFDVFKFFTSEILRKNSFRVSQFKQIVDSYKKTGVSALDLYVGKGGHVAPVLYVDDFLSTNGEINHYQNYENIAETLIMEREILHSRYSKLTHFSSNVHPSDSGMDARSVGRISQMCNIIEFTGHNYRINQQNI